MNNTDLKQIFKALELAPIKMIVMDHCKDIAYFKCSISITGEIGSDLGMIHGTTRKGIKFISVITDNPLQYQVQTIKNLDICKPSTTCADLEQLKEMVRKEILEIDYELKNTDLKQHEPQWFLRRS
jgi:hypothetical protein